MREWYAQSLLHFDRHRHVYRSPARSRHADGGGDLRGQEPEKSHPHTYVVDSLIHALCELWLSVDGEARRASAGQRGLRQTVFYPPRFNSWRGASISPPSTPFSEDGARGPPGVRLRLGQKARTKRRPVS